MPKALILHHYYSPDDVVSAIQFADLSEGLAKQGFEVEAWPSNRACHHPEAAYPLKKEAQNGVVIKRVWRPSFRQHSFLGRILNSLWLQKLWWLRLAFSPGYKPDIIITGTDPLFGIILTPFLKFLRPKAKMVHWCFDLYPEAAIADGIISEKSFLVRMIQFFLKPAYRSCDLVADLGPCMRNRLDRYPVMAHVTLTPWALEEPLQPLSFDDAQRKELFGNSSLGLLYSGSFGRAHDYALTLALARQMRDRAAFTYSARGSRLDELKQVITSEDTNLQFVSFAPPDKLSARLSAPDIHIVSLRPEWTGIVVPSKFFGVLAVGRPILFEGSETSAIALWIRQYQVGWVLTPNNIRQTKDELLQFSKDDDQKMAMFKHCHQVYQDHFSKKAVIENWDKELRALLGKPWSPYNRTASKLF